MKTVAVSLCTLAAAAALVACAAPYASREEPFQDLHGVAADEAAPCGSPAFCPDGRLRRDLLTEAPIFTARADEVEARAPRFLDDGTVARDPETGAPIYEERVDGRVVRCLVILP